MAILETFTKRQERLAKAGQQDVFQYDDLPAEFRVQVIHIWDDAVGIYSKNQYDRGSPANRFWKAIQKTMIRELGVFALSDEYDDAATQCKKYLLASDTGGALNIIEFSFRVIDRGVRHLHPYEVAEANIKLDPDEAIEELNDRFKEHGIGYQYVKGILVRLDSQFTHSEIVKPALALLNAEGFKGPADEFMRAFEHYRHDRNKEAIVEALKAFESTMKAICEKRKWGCSPTATAKQLIEVLFDKGLIPSYLESHFTSLRATLESGLPTLRNKTSGHGQGVAPVPVPPHLVAYALHLAASNIVFLVEAHRALR